MNFNFNKFKKYNSRDDESENELDYEFAEDFYFGEEYADYDDFDDIPEDF